MPTPPVLPGIHRTHRVTALRRVSAKLGSLALALLIGSGAALTATPAPAAELAFTEAQQRAVGIELAPVAVARGGDLPGLPAQVVIPNPQLRIVSAPLAALIDQILVAPQQAVRKGQPMARLLSPGLADAQHTYLQAVTRSRLEQANLDRAEALYRSGVIPERQLLATRAAYNEVAIDLAERTQALKLAGMSDEAIARLESGQKVGTSIVLVSPIDGVVIEQLAVVGQRVEASSPLFRVARLDPLWLEIQVPVDRLSGIRVGTAVRVASADAEARVIAVGSSVATGSQTALVRAEVSRGVTALRPGQLVEASIAAQAVTGRFEVPNAAIARVAGRSLLFVRTPGGFRSVEVTLVSEGPQRSVVTAALKGDEQVAVRGVASLKGALLGIGAE